MLPLLRFAADGQEHSLREMIENLAREFGLTDEERKELLPSGRQATVDNRVGWGRTYMNKANLLESTRRGYFHITERGQQILSQKPEKINISLPLLLNGLWWTCWPRWAMGVRVGKLVRLLAGPAIRNRRHIQIHPTTERN